MNNERIMYRLKENETPSTAVNFVVLGLLLLLINLSVLLYVPGMP
jgi:hypothetical protein